MSIKNTISLNLLPYDGEAVYIPDFIDHMLAKKMIEALNDNILWEQDEFLMYGKKIITSRKVGWYGSKPFEYTYSRIRRKAHLWNQELNQIRKLIEFETKNSFNSCLLNLYPEGTDGMGWHSDNEKELVPGATIASLSLGSDRKFSFKHRESKQAISLTLQNGSLLLMKGVVQKYWLHQVPKTKKAIGPRINLTFRNIIDGDRT